MFRSQNAEYLRDFGRDERGAVAIIFSLSLLVMLTAVGIGLDLGRALRAGSTVGAAVDAAVLAGAKGLRLQNLSDAEVTNVVTTLFNENLKSIGEVPTIKSFNIIIDRATSRVTLDVDAEIPTTLARLTGINALATPARGVAVFENKDIEIALQLDVTGSMLGSKLAALKVATKDLVDILIPDDPALLGGQKIRIGYAPYAAGINAGVYAGLINGGVAAPNTCVYERVNTSYQGTDDYPAGATVLATKLSAPAASTCSNAQILPMTADKTVLKSTVDSYWTNGSTAGHLGTAFAWYLLSPEWAPIWPVASQPVAYNAGTATKIAILMTDGEYNTLGGVHATSNVTPSQNFAKDTCDAMKAKGIIVYTVGFQLTEANATQTLQHCASGPAKFYPAEDADALRTAFQAIAQDIATLRLTE